LAPRAIAALRENSNVSNFLDGTIADLRRSMRRYEVTRSVLLPIATKPEQVIPINSSCTGLMAPETIPFGTLHPNFPNPGDEVERLVSLGIKGIKLHPEYQDFYIDDPSFFPAYEALQEKGLIVVFHAGKDPGPFTCDHALPPALLKVMTSFPRLTIVASHMGGWMVWDEVEAILAGKPIIFDCSAVYKYLESDRFVRLVHKHGAENVVFGTDSPWYDQGDVIRWIKETDLSDQQKESIFSGTALRILEQAKVPA